jgi:hypothetical protein
MIGRVKGVDVGGAPGPVWRLRGYKGVQRRSDAERDRQRACRERLLFLRLLLLLGWAGLDCAAWVARGSSVLVLGSVSILTSQPGSVSAVASSAPRHSSPALPHLAAHPAAKSTAAEWSPCRATLTLALLHMNLEPALPPSARRANTTSAVPRVAAPRTTHHSLACRLPPTRPLHTQHCSLCSACSSASPASLLCRHSTLDDKASSRIPRPPPTAHALASTCRLSALDTAPSPATR